MENENQPTFLLSRKDLERIETEGYIELCTAIDIPANAWIKLQFDPEEEG